MKILVIGAGAIGGMLAVRLSNTKAHTVTVLERDSHLEAIRAKGLKLINPDGTEQISTSLISVANISEIKTPQDIIFLAVKANQIADVAQQMSGIFHTDTVVIPLQNGLPWWYFQQFGGAHAGYRLRSADPEGVIEKHLPAHRIIGCVVYPAGERTAPGVIRHSEGDRFPIGELDGLEKPRTRLVAETLIAAGLKSPILEDIRSEIWLKLWGNMSFNPISALTHATLVDICQEPATRALAANMMREAQMIAEKLGVTFRVSLEKRIAGAEKVGAHKTSTLQDVEAGRRIEIDALIGSVIELGELCQIPTPSITAVYALLKLLESTLGKANGRLSIQSNTAS